MSKALYAKNASARATIALEILAKSTTGNLTRAFDDCFEMGDGDVVVRLGIEKLSKSRRFRDAVRRHRGIVAWARYVDEYVETE